MRKGQQIKGETIKKKSSKKGEERYKRGEKSLCS